MSASQTKIDHREHRGVPEWWLPLAAWVTAAVLGYVYLGRGWIPHDAGALGQASERILFGELPHRDFYDTYTGGLAFLNAAAFKLFGVGVLSMRWVFFAAYLMWVPVFWMIARRMAGRWPAAIGTLLAAAASLPVYPEGMPSWYNLFLATIGVWALLRHEASGRWPWLVMAGVAGGLSILFKVTGLFYLAGVGLYLLYREQMISRDGSRASTGSGSDLPYRVAVCGMLLLVAGATAATVLGAESPVMFGYFGVPPLVAIAVVAGRVALPTGTPARTRFGRIARPCFLVGLGAAVPVALFTLPYVVSGSLGALWQGAFVLPQSRFLHAAWTPPPISALAPPLAVAAWIVLSRRLVGPLRRPIMMAAAGTVIVGLALSHTDIGYRAFWYLISGGGVVLALAAAWGSMKGRGDEAAGVLLLGVYAYHALVQIPFAAPVYALYAFPMMVLLALSVASRAPVPARRSLHVVLAALLVFTLLRVDQGFLYHLGFRYRAHEQTEALALQRAAGIRVSAAEKAEYERLVSTVESLDPGPYILAFPDSPEVYFLSGKLNPTGSLFDFLDPDPEGREDRMLRRVDELGVRVVVLNRRPMFSGPASTSFLQALETRYPNATEVGRFLVVWRDESPEG